MDPEAVGRRAENVGVATLARGLKASEAPWSLLRSLSGDVSSDTGLVVRYLWCVGVA